MAYCPKCGKKNPDNASSCINCGAEIKKEEIEEFEPIATGVQPSKSDQKYKIGVAIAIITCIIVIASIIFFEYGEEKVEAKDTDDDGYPDNKDDFPNDPNLHKKTVLADWEDEKVKLGMHIFKKYISKNVKYVEWQYSVSPSSSYIRFYILKWFGDKTESIYHSYSNFEYQKINITFENYGYWDFGFRNDNENPIYLRAYIFMVE